MLRLRRSLVTPRATETLLNATVPPTITLQMNRRVGICLAMLTSRGDAVDSWRCRDRRENWEVRRVPLFPDALALVQRMRRLELRKMTVCRIAREGGAEGDGQCGETRRHGSHCALRPAPPICNDLHRERDRHSNCQSMAGGFSFGIAAKVSLEKSLCRRIRICRLCKGLIIGSQPVSWEMMWKNPVGSAAPHVRCSRPG